MPQNQVPIPSPQAIPAALSRGLLGVGLASLLARFWIAVTFPISGDEAFFYWWKATSLIGVTKE